MNKYERRAESCFDIKIFQSMFSQHLINNFSVKIWPLLICQIFSFLSDLDRDFNENILVT